MLVGGWRTSPTAIWATCHDLDPVDRTPAGGRARPVLRPRSRGRPRRPARSIRSPERRMVGGLVDGRRHGGAIRWAAACGRVLRRPAGAARATPRPGDRRRHRALRIGRRTAVCRTRTRRSADRSRRRRVVDRRVHRTPTGRRRRRGHARRPRATSSCCATSRSNSVSTCAIRPTSRRCCAASASRCPTHGPGASRNSATLHPFVDDLLVWRKAERVSTTFGYSWLDANVGADGRLRGEWSASDGAAGRMTATAGLHNMPADLRPAIVAEPGFVFVRADLGQIEPRILAAVSGDVALAAATQEATCTRRSRPDSASNGTSRRWPCSARCTARPPVGAPRRCTGWRRTIRSPCRTCPTRPAQPKAATTCARAVDAWCGWAAASSTDRTSDGSDPGTVASGGAQALRAQCDGAGRGRRVLQDVGRDRASAAGAARRRGAHRAVPARRTRAPRAASTRGRGRPGPGGLAAGGRLPVDRRPPTDRTVANRFASGSSPTSA